MMAALALLIGWSASASQAQPIYRGSAGSIGRPAYSPYLNLLRGGDPGVNYYGLVRPEIDFRNSVQNLQQQITQGFNATNQAIDQVTGLPLTGHGVVFLNTSHYFAGSGALRSGAYRQGGLAGGTFGGAVGAAPQTGRSTTSSAPTRR
jgi:hypothetical protein